MLRLLKAIGPVVVCAAFFAMPHVARANQSAAITYCAPPVIFTQGQTINADPFNQNFGTASTCPAQYGDMFSDGPFYDPTVPFSGSSFNFTIPANTWVALGARVPTSASALVAPASATSYWWLSRTGLWTCTLDTGPPTNACPGFNLPDTTYVSEYTIAANGSGITAITLPTIAGIKFNGTVALTSFPSGSCLQTTTGGVLTATGLPCGSGGSGIASVTGSGNINAVTVSGAVMVSEASSPTWTGTPTTASATQAGSFNFGSDGAASLARTGASAFAFTAVGPATLSVPGGVLSGSSIYGPTSAFLNGGLTASAVTDSGLSVGQCVQTTTGGLLATTGAACAGLGNVLSVAAGGSGNVTCSPTTGNVICDTVNNPTFSGAVVASSFTGSGAGLTSGTVPNVALVTPAVTSVTGTSPIASSGGTTPAISIASNPALSGTVTGTSFRATAAIVAGSASAFLPSNNDLSASETTTCGAIYLGGSSDKGKLDYGCTSGSTFTFGTNTTVGGTLAATTLKGTTLTSGNCVQATTGGVLITTSSACGSATSVTSVVGTSPVGVTTSVGVATVTCTTCLTGLTAGSNISVGSGTTPSVAVASSPTFSGQIGADGNAAPAAGIALGATTTPATITSGVSLSAAFAFKDISANCGTGFIEFVKGASTVISRIDCTGNYLMGSSSYGTNATIAGSLSAGTTISGGNIQDSGLGSTVTPICGNNAAAIAPCGQLTPMFATTGNATKASGTSANTLQQLGASAPSLTLGTSAGPNGQWLVKAHLLIRGASGSTSEYLYGCLSNTISGGSITPQQNSADEIGTTCWATPGTGSVLAGTVGFGQTSSAGNQQYGLDATAEAIFLAPNGATITIYPWIGASTNASVNVSGALSVEADPY